ncbi:MAG TPA: hypothetical protein ENG80_03555 [Nitrospirae bacterium]|nr:hypothetical protein [Nitrospirota bacterium]
MKYLLTLLAIVLAVTSVTVFYLWPESGGITDKNILVTVNGHSLPRSLLEREKAQSVNRSKDDKAILDYIVIRELLLQEAKRLNIDKEPSFRMSVQNYYEQSLIKFLIDRHFRDTKTKVTDHDIDQYISNYGKIFTYTRLSGNNSHGSGRKPEQRSILFDDLSDSLKLILGSMKCGEVVTMFNADGEAVSFRLDRIEPGPYQESFHGNRELIRKIISNYKKERELTAWIKKIRDRATIIIPDKTRP